VAGTHPRAAYCSGRSPWASGRTTSRSPTTHGPRSATGWLWAGTRRPSAKCWRPTCSSRRSRPRHPRNGVTPCSSGRRSPVTIERAAEAVGKAARVENRELDQFRRPLAERLEEPAPSSSRCTRPAGPEGMSDLFDDEAFKQSAAGTLFYGKELVAWIWPARGRWTSSHQSFGPEQPRRSPVSDRTPTRNHRSPQKELPVGRVPHSRCRSAGASPSARPIIRLSCVRPSSAASWKA
jgi:hypothetical protein